MARVKNNSKALLAESDRLIKQKLEIAALLVEKTAKLPGFCPVDTGTSRRSITRFIERRRAVIGSNVEYFPYHELGTSKMPAHASLRRALETNVKQIKRLFGVR